MAEKTIADNLALACFPCNRYKGSDIASFDPQTGDLSRLFDPRVQRWEKHFSVKNGYIIGESAIGRTTVFLLQFNAVTEVTLRQMLIDRGLFL